MFRVCVCNRGGMVVMDVIWRRLCVKYDLRKGDLCCMFVSCVHPLAFLNAEFLNDLQFVNYGRGCKRYTPELVS